MDGPFPVDGASLTRRMFKALLKGAGLRFGAPLFSLGGLPLLRRHSGEAHDN